MDSQNTKSPLTDKILSEHPEINNEPASRPVFYRMTLERYEAFFAEKRYSWSSVSDEEILRDIFESIHESPGLCYMSLLIRENSDLICTVRENLKKTEQYTKDNGISLAEINDKVSTVEKNLGDFSYQNFVVQLSKFNTESGALQAVVTAYNDRLQDHIKMIDSLADKATVNSLRRDFDRFEVNFGSVTSASGFANYVKQELDTIKSGLGDTSKESLSSQISTSKSYFENKIGNSETELKKFIQGSQLDGNEGVEGNLKRLILGPQLDGKGGVQYKVDTNAELLARLSQKVTLRNTLVAVLISALTNGIVLLGILYTGYASLTGFVKTQVQETLEAELNKENGIKFQINQNTVLLEKISEKLDVETENTTTPSPQTEEGN